MKEQQKTTALRPIDSVRRDLGGMESQFKMVLPQNITPERFARVVLTALQKNPDLMEVDRQSLLGAAMAAAQDGLLPDGREGAIVPFSGKAQWMPMARGLMKLARNSGEVTSITVEVIYTSDLFKYKVTTDGPVLEHEPDLFSENRGEVRGAYAIATTKDGEPYIEVMNRAQLDKVRAVSRSANGATWTKWYDEMAKKSVIRRLSKRLPMSTDLEDVFERDNANFDLTQPTTLPEGKAPRRIDSIVAKAANGSDSDEDDEQEEPERQMTPDEIAAAAVDKL